MHRRSQAGECDSGYSESRQDAAVWMLSAASYVGVRRWLWMSATVSAYSVAAPPLCLFIIGQASVQTDPLPHLSDKQPVTPSHPLEPRSPQSRHCGAGVGDGLLGLSVKRAELLSAVARHSIPASHVNRGLAMNLL